MVGSRPEQATGLKPLNENEMKTSLYVGEVAYCKCDVWVYGHDPMNIIRGEAESIGSIRVIAGTRFIPLKLTKGGGAARVCFSFEGTLKEGFIWAHQLVPL